MRFTAVLSLRRAWMAWLFVAAWWSTPCRCHGQRWPDEHASGPFHYHADFQLRPFMPLLNSISTLQYDVPQQLGLNSLGEPIHVFLFARKSTYEGYMERYFPGVPRRQALFVKQRGPGMVFAQHGKEIATDLRHEVTHAVLHGILPLVPLWLDEGLAEYFEVPAAERASAHPHLKPTIARAHWRRVADLSELEELRDISQMRATHYRDAWAWVHFMVHGPPPGREVLASFLQDIEAHVPPGKLSTRLRRDIPDLETQYLRHFRQWREASGK